MITLYHNPACSKSRRTLEILREKNIPVQIINYLETPPSADELTQLLAKLNLSPRDILRTGEDAYRQCGLNNPDTNDADIINAIHTHPILLQRPIATRKNHAIIARPPERILEFMGGRD